MRIILFIFLMLLATFAGAEEPVLNIYVWSNEIPYGAIKQFEKDTGIKVNYSTFDSNEVLFAKLTAAGNPGYDIIQPTSYYADRMRKLNMLEKIDTKRLSNFHYVAPEFLHPQYDPEGDYTIPFVWGATGIFYNTKFFPNLHVTSWSQLWNTQFRDKLLLLDDPREVFSLALMVLGLSPNTSDPAEIVKAYEKIRTLTPNIKIFNSQSTSSYAIDDDVTIGIIWNGDFFNAKRENPNLRFVYPEDGFVIWVDTLAIPKDAPHVENAYKFINYMLRPDIAKWSTMENGFPTANWKAKELLPPDMQNDPVLYPSAAILQHGIFQTDVTTTALALYAKYWELLKLGM
ncbi:MAG: spermidine/putrescine ABC transporter substrate-binding protein [Legionellales bacterium]|nr:spermidine/putrescine ABC transporter substrate-binding protein [Legionellales bacterium]